MPDSKRMHSQGMMRVRRFNTLAPVMRCVDCKETRNVCNRTGCENTKEVGWREISDAD